MVFSTAAAAAVFGGSMVSCDSTRLSLSLSLAGGAADFINSELWSSAVTVEMKGRGLCLEEGAGCRQDAITVRSLDDTRCGEQGR